MPQGIRLSSFIIVFEVNGERQMRDQVPQVALKNLEASHSCQHSLHYQYVATLELLDRQSSPSRDSRCHYMAAVLLDCNQVSTSSQPSAVLQL
jgi:hypothetical protein